MSGIEVLNQLQKAIQDDYLPVIVLTAQTDMETRQQALESGAKDFITKPFEDWEVRLRIKNMLETRRFYTRQVLRGEILEQEVNKRTQEIWATQLEIVRRLGVAGEFRDDETGAHVTRMSEICSLLSREYGLGEEYSEMLLYASTMHDVGKIGIPDAILQKPGKLTQKELHIMQQHPQIGANIIGSYDSPLLNLARETALYHHEKWDGSGYPHGISGEAIPIAARIAAISDVFDALTSSRPYKEAWSIEKTLKLIEEQSGRHFEPKLVDIFMENLSEIIEIKNHHYDKVS